MKWAVLVPFLFIGCVNIDTGGSSSDLGTLIDNIGVEITYFEPYATAYYNAYVALDIPDLTAHVTNDNGRAVELRLRSEYPGYSHEATDAFTLGALDATVFDQIIPLDLDKVRTLESRTSVALDFVLEVRYEGEWKEVYSEDAIIDFLPPDNAVLYLEEDPAYEMLAAFVTPDAEPIEELLSAAKEWHPRRSLEGYQCGDCSPSEHYWYATEQVEAIYNALKHDYGLSYLNMPTAFNSDKDYVQRVNLPYESLYLRSANCLDGAFLMSSALESLGFYTYIVLVPGHAYIAWDTTYGVETYDYDFMGAVETTMLGSHEFEDARVAGENQLFDDFDRVFGDFDGEGLDATDGYYPVEVQAMHEAGVRPL